MISSQIMTKSSIGWKKYSLWIFVALAYAISWVFMVPAFIIAEQRGYILPTALTIGELMKTGFQDNLHILLTVIGTFSSYGPLIAAVIMAGMEGELHHWWNRVTKWRVGGRGYRDLFVLILAVFVPLILIGLVLGPFPTLGLLAAPLTFVLPYALYELLTSGMEEPGWRGYALPRLQENYSAKKSSFILGLGWGLWHWPAFIPMYFSLLNVPGTSAIAAFIQAAIQCLIYIFSSILAASFIETWLYNRTQSAFMNILHHGGANAIGGYVLAVIHNPMMGLVYGVTRWVVAVVLMRYFWKEPEKQANTV